MVSKKVLFVVALAVFNVYSSDADSLKCSTCKRVPARSSGSIKQQVNGNTRTTFGLSEPFCRETEMIWCDTGEDVCVSEIKRSDDSGFWVTMGCSSSGQYPLEPQEFCPQLSPKTIQAGPGSPDGGNNPPPPSPPAEPPQPPTHPPPPPPHVKIISHDDSRPPDGHSLGDGHGHKDHGPVPHLKTVDLEKPVNDAKDDPYDDEHHDIRNHRHGGHLEEENIPLPSVVQNPPPPTEIGEDLTGPPTGARPIATHDVPPDHHDDVSVGPHEHGGPPNKRIKRQKHTSTCICSSYNCNSSWRNRFNILIVGSFVFISTFSVKY